MKTNLKLLRIDLIRFNFKVKLSEELIEKIRSVCPPDEDGDCAFYDYYRVENVGHVAYAVVSQLKGNVGEYGFSFLYTCGKRGRLLKDSPKISSLLEVVSVIADPVLFNCLVRFTFSKRSKIRGFVNLPMKVSAQPNALFNEIHGAHFVKLEDGETKYEVILDIIEGGALMQTVMFENKIRISESGVGHILRTSLEISGRFVSKEE